MKFKSSVFPFIILNTTLIIFSLFYLLFESNYFLENNLFLWDQSVYLKIFSNSFDIFTNNIELGKPFGNRILHPLLSALFSIIFHTNESISFLITSFIYLFFIYNYIFYKVSNFYNNKTLSLILTFLLFIPIRFYLRNLILIPGTIFVFESFLLIVLFEILKNYYFDF